MATFWYLKWGWQTPIVSLSCSHLIFFCLPDAFLFRSFSGNGGSLHKVTRTFSDFKLHIFLCRSDSYPVINVSSVSNKITVKGYMFRRFNCFFEKVRFSPWRRGCFSVLHENKLFFSTVIKQGVYYWVVSLQNDGALCEVYSHTQLISSSLRLLKLFLFLLYPQSQFSLFFFIVFNFYCKPPLNCCVKASGKVG